MNFGDDVSSVNVQKMPVAGSQVTGSRSVLLEYQSALYQAEGIWFYPNRHGIHCISAGFILLCWFSARSLGKCE